MILAKRLAQSVHNAAFAMNRLASTGGGSGMMPVLPLGSSAYTSNQTTGSTSETAVPGSAFSITVGRSVWILALAMVSAYMSSGAIAAGNVRIDGGGQNESPRMRFPLLTGSVSIVEMAYLLTFVSPGTYTWQLKFYVDTTPDILTINDYHLDAFQLG